MQPSELKGVLITEAPMQPKQNREKMVQIMFEEFNCNNVYVAIQAVMSLYSAGRTTGVVVDSGDGVSHTVPVFEGFKIDHAIKRIPIAGRVLTEYLQKLLLEAGFPFASSSELQIVKSIKEKCSYVAANFKEEIDAAKANSSTEMEYELPDLKKIMIPGTCRISCPELLFDPALNGLGCESL